MPDDDLPDSAPAADPWLALRRFTAARIALGHAGVSQPTAAQLAFQLAHAQARDAVHQPLDTAALAAALAAALQPAWPGLPAPLELHSAARDRHVYLQRPDLGRRLDAASRARLASYGNDDNDNNGDSGDSADRGRARPDLAIVVADGLSARAVMENAAPLLYALRGQLASADWSLAPLVIVEQGWVAIGDEIGQVLGARMVVVLIGERPGLSSPDSLGAYLTWAPRIGLTDASRNCISNIRPAGLGCEQAASRLHYLLAEARRRAITGIGLKDESGAAALPAGAGPAFLL